MEYVQRGEKEVTVHASSWKRVKIEFHASSIVNIRHVILKPSSGLGRLRVVGLASQAGTPYKMKHTMSFEQYGLTAYG